MQAGGANQTQSQSQPHGTMQGYDPNQFFCEMLRPGQPQHPTLTLLLARLAALPIDNLRRRAQDAERDLLERGITFTVYSDATAIDRILPFDLIPRVITPTEWHQIETGVIQRVRALNMFLRDIYHERKILADKIVPAELVLKNAGYCEAMVGLTFPSTLMYTSAAPISCATKPAPSGSWKITPARPPASPTWSKTAT